ncbi:MAG: S16 family serine protease [Pirellulaceae bacterium]
MRRCLEYALETRRRVKEQLKKIGGMEFFDVHFSYIDTEKSEEKYISVPEQGGGSLIPDGPLNPGVMHTVAVGSGGHLGLYRIETQVTAGNGSLKMSGFGSNSQAKEAVKVGFDYFKANATHVSASIKSLDHDYHLHVVELHNSGPTNAMTLSTFVALCSAVLGKPIQPQMVVLGSMSLGGSIIPVENLAESLQVAHDSGAKRILLPMASVRDIPTIPGELFAKFQTSFYADPRDAAFSVLFVACPQDGCLELVAKGGRAVQYPLQQAFCKAVLGLDIDPADPQRPEYQLQQVLDPEFRYPTEPGDCIACVRLSRIRLEPVSHSRKVIFHELKFSPKVLRTDWLRVIQRELDGHGMTAADVRVKQASFQLVFVDRAVAGAKTLTFTVCLPNTCDLKSKPDSVREIGERCLQRWGMINA